MWNAQSFKLKSNSKILNFFHCIQMLLFFYQTKYKNKVMFNAQSSYQILMNKLQLHELIKIYILNAK